MRMLVCAFVISIKQSWDVHAVALHVWSGPFRGKPDIIVHCNKGNFTDFSKKQEGQVALNRSTEFCLKLTYRYLLEVGTWGGHF